MNKLRVESGTVAARIDSTANEVSDHAIANRIVAHALLRAAFTLV